jgi:hypothetical protein
LGRGRELRQGTLAQRWDGDLEAEHAITEPGNDVAMSKAVNRVHQVRSPSQRVRVAGADADLERQLGWAHGRRAACGVQMAAHRSGKEHCRRADERRVNDLEVVVREWKQAFGCARQRSQP